MRVDLFYWEWVLREDRGPSVLNLFPSYAWQILFVPLFGLFGLLLLVFVWYELRDRTGLLLMVAAIACLVVAVGLDFVEGLDADHPWNVYSWITSRVDLADFTAARQIVERLTRVDAETIDYRITATDPMVWTGPWTALMPMTAIEGQLFEYACHEGNYAIPNMLAGARAEEAR